VSVKELAPDEKPSNYEEPWVQQNSELVANLMVMAPLKLNLALSRNAFCNKKPPIKREHRVPLFRISIETCFPACLLFLLTIPETVGQVNDSTSYFF
jgi:hypothetical protein